MKALNVDQTQSHGARATFKEHVPPANCPAHISITIYPMLSQDCSEQAISMPAQTIQDEIELHIWGPAFGLPSIDPQCIAATVYLNQLLPKDQWRLVVAYDPSTSPNGDFPLLKHGSTLVSGFSNIVDYLKQSDLSLDNRLNSTQRADATAIRSHLVTHALPLLDAHLYVSSPNYLNYTRPAWNRILPSPFRQIVLSQRYKAACGRTSSLNLSSTAVDAAPDSDFTSQQEQEARMISSRPSLLFRRRQTVMAALKKEQMDMKFTLTGMVRALLDPLDAFLNDNKYLVSASNGPTSIDCLCFGYLALLLYTRVENNWVEEIMRQRSPAVCKYIDSLRLEFVGTQSFDIDAITTSTTVPSTDVDPAFALPYRKASQSTASSVVFTVGTSLLARWIKPSRLHFLFPAHVPACINEPRSVRSSWLSPINVILAFSGPLLTAAAGLLYVASHTDMERNKRFGRPKPQLESFGAAGALLAGLRVPSQQRRPSVVAREPQYIPSGPAMEERDQDSTISPTGNIDGIDVEISTG